MPFFFTLKSLSDKQQSFFTHRHFKYVLEETQKCPFSSLKTAPERKKSGEMVSTTFSKGFCFEQDKLHAMDEEDV